MSLNVPSRGAERRRENLGGPAGVERRDLADRRAENNVLYVCFRVGASTYLLDVHEVLEIVPAPSPLPVPLAPPAVAGLINLRGRILPALDLRSLLGEPPGPPPALGVVAIAGEDVFTILVDEVDDVVALSPTAFRLPPATLGGASRVLARAVCQHRDALLVVLDPHGFRRLVDPAGSTREAV